MKIPFSSLNVAITLAAIAFLTIVMHLLFAMRFLPGIGNSLPEDQPDRVVVVLLLLVAFVGGWLWALLASVRNSRVGLIALLIFSLLGAVGWGVSSVVVFCRARCAVVWPVAEVINWSNVISRLATALAIGFYLRSKTDDYSS
jgi:hypothetical protein